MERSLSRFICYPSIEAIHAWLPGAAGDLELKCLGAKLGEGPKPRGAKVWITGEGRGHVSTMDTQKERRGDRRI